MLRIFTKNHGRIQAGEVRDYSLSVWRAAYPQYEIYTYPVEAALKEWLATRQAPARKPSR